MTDPETIPDYVPTPSRVTVQAARHTLNDRAESMEKHAARCEQEADEHRAAAAVLEENARYLRDAARDYREAAARVVVTTIAREDTRP